MKKLLALLLFVATSGSSQKLISSYAPQLKGRPYLSEIDVDHEGNFYISGNFDYLNSATVGSLIKVDQNGKGVAAFARIYADRPITSVLVLPDKKVLIRGSFSKINGVATKRLVRLQPNGTIDPTFTAELDLIDLFNVQSTGKIVVTGDFKGYKGYYNMARLNANGTLDETFDKPSVPYYIKDFTIDKDDNIILIDLDKAYKYNSNGLRDDSFNSGNGTESTGQLWTVKTTPDGKILVGGFFSKYNGLICSALAQLQPDGTVDAEFKVGSGIGGQILDIAVRSNGNIIVGGQFGSFLNQSASLVEFKPNGELQKIIAVVYTNNIESICVTTEGKIAFIGGFETVNGLPWQNAVLFEPNYSIKTSFKPDIASNNPNGRMLEVSSQHVVTTGGYDIDGVYVNGGALLPGRIFSLDALGEPKTTFSTTISYPIASAIQDNDKILISRFGFQSDAQVVRLNENGTIDPSLQMGTGTTYQGFANSPSGIQVHNGTIYLNGQFDSYNGAPTKGLVAINTDGSLKQAYPSLPTDTFPYIYRIAFQSDGKIVAMGQFLINGVAKKIIRINTDGSIDNTMSEILIVGNPQVLQIDSKDRIYIGGDFYSVNGSLLTGLVRMLPGGELDPNFNAGSGFSSLNGYNTVYSIAFLPNNQIAAGGYLENFNGNKSPGFVLLSENGDYIPLPNVKFGEGSVAVQLKYLDNRLYLSGRFVSEDLKTIYGVAKISLVDTPAPASPTGVEVTLAGPAKSLIKWSDQSNNEDGFLVERSLSETDGFLRVASAQANSTSAMDINIEAEKKYYYRVRAVNDGGPSLSNVVSFTWIPAPIAPASLVVAQEKLNELILSWEDKSLNEVGFVIERTKDGVSEKIDSVDVNITSYVDKTVAPDKTYIYRVAAFNLGGISLFSNDVTVVSLSVPAQPIQLAGVQQGANEITLSWVDKSTNEQGFILERSLDAGKTFSPLTLPENATTYVDTIEPPIEAYTYRIKSFNKVGSSEVTELQLNVIVGLNESTQRTTVYPIPAGDFIYVENVNHIAGNLYLVNTLGQRLAVPVSELNEKTLVLDVRGMEPGLYILGQLTTGAQLTRVRIAR